jgi:hypothetical protein
MNYNDFIGIETINKEYKEFTFNLAGLFLDNKLAEYYCNTNKFIFNQNVIDNLIRYFILYLPKYVCGFFNSNINSSKYFIIGVNDYGIIKGIPYISELPFKLLKLKMHEIINKYIHNSSDFKINFKKIIKINFIKINNPDKPLHNINQKYIKYLEKKAIYLKELNKYIEEHKIWRNKLLSISQTKLVILVNSNPSRKLIINYIKSIDKNNKFINLLESNYIVEKKEHNEIIILKQDINNIYYWITKWKDTIIDEIRKSKPKFNIGFNLHNVPLNLIISVNEMIPYWFHNNKNMNLYLLNIKLKNRNFNNIKFYYKTIHNKICSCYRTIENGQPVCLPIN